MTKNPTQREILINRQEDSTKVVSFMSMHSMIQTLCLYECRKSGILRHSIGCMSYMPDLSVLFSLFRLISISSIVHTRHARP